MGEKIAILHGDKAFDNGGGNFLVAHPFHTAFSRVDRFDFDRSIYTVTRIAIGIKADHVSLRCGAEEKLVCLVIYGFMGIDEGHGDQKNAKKCERDNRKRKYDRALF